VVIAFLIFAFPVLDSAATVLDEELKRRNNRNYANACSLLAKKRNAKVKPAKKSKRTLPKWR
jgi:hypothetical protein